ncbi:MAG: hypothetical protein ACLPX1_11190 [Steroidobacteraceae bacterium]
MEIKRFFFLCLCVIALSALSAAPSSAQGGSEIDLKHLHQVRSALHQAHSANQLLALPNLSVGATANAAAPSLTPLTNQLPDGINFTMLLTDGTVMAQDATYLNMWWKLTPDIHGSYLNGTWTQLASLPVSYSPYAASEAVLSDGRVVVIGGEYSGPDENFTLTNEGAIYDPRTDTWSPLAAPPGFNNIGDSPNSVLPDGRFLLGDKLTKQDSALDPHTLRWTKLGSTGKNDFNAEEGWTLLPDGTVLTLDVLDAPKAEAYSAWEQEWMHIRNVPVDLHSPTTVVGCLPYGPAPNQCYYPPGEIGPAILRPDGTVFATGSYANADPTFSPGSAGHTAIYNTHTRTWTQGPDFPIGIDIDCFINCGMVGDNAGDEWAVLLPNGKVLVEGVIFGYEFDGTQLITTVPESVYMGSLSVLPSGEVLFGGYSPGGAPAQLYASPGEHDPAWEPVIAWVQNFSLQPGSTYRVWGFQFNGLSQADAFGDEFQAAQNYPLVRITNKATHHVFYARTHDHSTMGVATGDQLVWTNFDVPQQIETGASRLEVVANGIASQPVDVWVQAGDQPR